MLMMSNTWERISKISVEGLELNRWELVPEGERRSDRSSNGAMELPAGFSWTFLLARASAFTKKVSPSARGISRASAVKLRSSVSRNGKGRSPLSLFLATASPPVLRPLPPPLRTLPRHSRRSRACLPPCLRRTRILVLSW